MKMKILTLAVLASIAFIACQKEDDKNSQATSQTTNNSDIDIRILGKWKQAKWYYDPKYNLIEQFNTIQTWEFLENGKLIRTYEYPNNPEYNTFVNNNDTWQMYAQDNYLRAKTDSFFCVLNNGSMHGSNFMEYDIEKLNNNTLIIISSDIYTYYHEKFIFISDN